MKRGRILAVGEMVTNRGYGLNGDIATITSLKASPIVVATNISSYFGNQKMPIQNMQPGYIGQQLRAAFDPPGIDAVKIGYLNCAESIHTICDYFDSHHVNVPVIVNPVLLSAVGEYLFNDEIIEALLSRLIKHADLLMLNIPEAEIISGIDITDKESLEKATSHIYELGSKGVFITGGLLLGDEAYDSLIYKNSASMLSMPKSKQQMNEGYRYSGSWALAAALATSLGQQLEVMEAVNRARSFVDTAIATSFKSDQVYQNLNLAHTVKDYEHEVHYKPYTVIPGSLQAS